jgi:hypothetical protein
LNIDIELVVSRWDIEPVEPGDLQCSNCRFRPKQACLPEGYIYRAYGMRFLIFLEVDGNHLTGRERTSERTFYPSDERVAFSSFDTNDVIVPAVIGLQMRRKNHKFAAC